jgi:hypothetical protein
MLPEPPRRGQAAKVVLLWFGAAMNFGAAGTSPPEAAQMARISLKNEPVFAPLLIRQEGAGNGKIKQ